MSRLLTVSRGFHCRPWQHDTSIPWPLHILSDMEFELKEHDYNIDQCSKYPTTSWLINTHVFPAPISCSLTPQPPIDQRKMQMCLRAECLTSVRCNSSMVDWSVDSATKISLFSPPQAELNGGTLWAFINFHALMQR